MSQEFEGDLAGSEFWGADLSGSVFRDVDLTGARISHAFVVDVDIDAVVERLVVNGVDVTAYVNERDPWWPLRMVPRSSTAAEMRDGWAALDAEWRATIELARSLPEPSLHESVGGEWSFVDSVRHLVFAIDKWFVAPILRSDFHPIGLPNSGSIDFPWPGLDLTVSPSLAEALEVRAMRTSSFSDYLADVAQHDLGRTVEVLENGPHEVADCIRTVLEETFWHLRYVRRDLAELGAGDEA